MVYGNITITITKIIYKLNALEKFEWRRFKVQFQCSPCSPISSLCCRIQLLHQGLATKQQYPIDLDYAYMVSALLVECSVGAYT